MQKKTSHSVLILVLLAGCWLSQPASAQQGVTLEFLAGQYFPSDDAIGDDVVYGVRGGYRFSEHLGLDASLSLFRPSEIDSGFGKIDLNMAFTDVSLKWYPKPGHRAEVFFYGGPGWAFFDLQEPFPASADSFTLHSGVGVDVKVNDRFYIRPDIRGRWIEDSSDVDFEVSVGFGFRVGGGWRGPNS